MRKSILLIITTFLLLFIIPIKINTLSLSNEEKFFLRISEKYDLELHKKWKDSILFKNELIKEIKSKNLYENYKEYIKINKNNDLLRSKKKYIKKLNNVIEDNNQDKIKRYLNLLLNIFNEENNNLKKYFEL